MNKNSNKKSSHPHKHSDKNSKQERSKLDDDKRSNDEVIDVTSINYVKSSIKFYFKTEYIYKSEFHF